MPKLKECPYLVKACPKALHLLGQREGCLLGIHWRVTLYDLQHCLFSLADLLVCHGTLNKENVREALYSSLHMIQ